jgi:diguanylate cyclase (GGDEF)-like protein
MNPETAKIVNGENLPSPPTIAAELLELVNQPDARISEITKAISADPKLSAKLIDYCNSPIVASSRTVGSLQQAVTLLGMRTLRLLSLSFSVMDTRGGNGFPYEEFWRYSLGTAITSKLLSKHLGYNADEDFLLGLVFNIGLMGIGAEHTGAFAARFKDNDFVGSMSTAAEREICGTDRYEVGARLLEKWNFPVEMVQVIDEYRGVEGDQRSRLFYAAQFLSRLLLTPHPNVDDLQEARQVASDTVAIEAREFNRLFDQMIGDWKSYESLFNFDSIAFDSVGDLEAKARASVVQISLGMEQTIREMSQQQEELRELALRDGLTQLKNRSAFNIETSLASEQLRRQSSSFSLLIIDIDHFKSFNDTYGHTAGDTVLQTVAGCLQKNCRKSDPVYRFGGEEFVVLLANCDYESTGKVAERLRSGIEALRIEHGENLLCVTASIGACWVDRGRFEDFQAVFESADLSLYAAKRRGRNTSVVARLQKQNGLPDLSGPAMTLDAAVASSEIS